MNVSFRGSNDGIAFDDIERMFQKRDLERAEAKRTEDALYRRQSAARAAQRPPMRQQPYSMRQQPQGDEFNGRTRTASPQGARRVRQEEGSLKRVRQEEPARRIRQEDAPLRRHKPRYTLRPRAYVLAALMLLSTAFGIKSCGGDSGKTDAMPLTSVVQETDLPSNVLPDEFILDASFDSYGFPEASEAVITGDDIYKEPQVKTLEIKLQEAMEDSDVRQTFYDLQKTIDRASKIIGEPLLPFLENACKEHADGLNHLIPLIMTFMESSGRGGKDGLMEVTQIAVQDVKERYGGIYNTLDPSKPKDNLIFGIKYIELCYNRYTDGTDRAMAVRYNNCSLVQNIEGQDVVTKEWYGDKFVKYYNTILNNPELVEMLECGMLKANDTEKSVELIVDSQAYPKT